MPAIAPVVEATCRSLARVRMAGTAARPLLSDFKDMKSFRHNTASENTNKSEAPILRLEIQAASLRSIRNYVDVRGMTTKKMAPRLLCDTPPAVVHTLT